MDTSLGLLDPTQGFAALQQSNTQLLYESLSITIQRDTVSFGENGIISTSESISIVLERATFQLLSVVGDAQAALGIESTSPFDTSAEATANRILDFALNFFGQFLANHEELGEDDARQAFVDLIGGAITQGIDEARGILELLNALSPEVGGKVDSIAEFIQRGLDAFLNGE